MDICFDIYVTNGQNKQTLQIYNFFWNYARFSKSGSRKLFKKNIEYESIVYII